MKVRVIVVDHHTRSRAALADSLVDSDDISVSATAGDSAAALLRAEWFNAQVVLVATPFTESLADLCASLHASPSQPQIVLLDRDADDGRLLHAIEAGVNGYVPPSAGVAGVADAIHRIVRGEAVIPSTMLGPLLRRLIQRRREADSVADKLVDLTRRERQVLALLVDGLGHHDIAANLVISPETARTHVQRILRKLGVHSRKEAIVLVSQAGLADRLESLVERSRP